MKARLKWAKAAKIALALGVLGLSYEMLRHLSTLGEALEPGFICAAAIVVVRPFGPVARWAIPVFAYLGITLPIGELLRHHAIADNVFIVLFLCGGVWLCRLLLKRELAR